MGGRCLRSVAIGIIKNIKMSFSNMYFRVFLKHILFTGPWLGMILEPSKLVSYSVES